MSLSALSVCRQLLARGHSSALSRASRSTVSLSAKQLLLVNSARGVACTPNACPRIARPVCARTCRCARCHTNHVISQYAQVLHAQIRLLSTGPAAESKKPTEAQSEPAAEAKPAADAPATPAPEPKSDQPAAETAQPQAKDGSATINSTSSPAPSEGPRGPTTLLHLAIITLLLALGVYQYNTIKEQKLTTVRSEQKVIGTPKLGGPFQLTESTKGSPVTERDFLGEYILIYFGFTHCPDICPSELKKMDEALQLVDQAQDIRDAGIQVKPIFITVDPKRDTLPKLEAYKKELPLHPRTICLTGTDEQLSKIAKAYRMYYSKPPADAKDYMVDHSIFFFLVGPDGKFMEYYGKNLNATEVASKMRVALMSDKGRRAEAGQWPLNKAEILQQYEQQVGPAPQT